MEPFNEDEQVELEGSYQLRQGNKGMIITDELQVCEIEDDHSSPEQEDFIKQNRRQQSINPKRFEAFEDDEYEETLLHNLTQAVPI